MMNHLFGSQSPSYEIWIELQAPGFSLIQSWLLQTFEE